MHGGLYLLLALTGSGALQQAADYTLGSAHWSGENPAAVWAGLAVAGLCYLLAVRDRSGSGSASVQVFRLAVAAAVAWLVAGASAGALTAGYHAAFGPTAGAAQAIPTVPRCEPAFWPVSRWLSPGPARGGAGWNSRA